jgi:hypothetical protein
LLIRSATMPPLLRTAGFPWNVVMTLHVARFALTRSTQPFALLATDPPRSALSNKHCTRDA